MLINDFVIKEKTVSGKHAAIEQKQDGYFLIDLKSTNGTRINGKVIDPNVPNKLNDGDVIFENEVYPGIIERVDGLSVQGFNLFVATSKPVVFARDIMETAKNLS